ncbi:MAG: chloride channel protein [Candidatus Sumerlaeia bacterium]|nr:chloride channel protein [Candidatus Sumerlaeia bacterium]
MARILRQQAAEPPPRRSGRAQAYLRAWVAEQFPPARRVAALAIPVGLIAGLIASAYRRVLGFHFEREALGPLSSLLAGLLTVVAPVAGCVIAVAILGNVEGRERVRTGMNEVIRALTTGHFSGLNWRTGLHAALSLFTIKSGASAGPEGPIAELGALTGIGLARGARLTSGDVNTIAACGTAAGIAAVFNAPLGGILFAIEIILGSFTLASAIPIVLAAVTGAAVSRAIFGQESIFSPPAPDVVHIGQLPLFLLLGAGAGLVASAFLHLVRLARARFPARLRHSIAGAALAGAASGVAALLLPQVGGEGYEAINEFLRMAEFTPVLIAIVVAKGVCTTLVVASGTPGGAFAPSLVMGAGLGALAATAFPGAFGSTAGDVSITVLAGMGAMVAGVFHAPLTALLILFEITGSDPAVIVPVLASTGVAAMLANQLTTGSFYEQSLIDSGFDRRRYAGLAHVTSRRAADFADTVVDILAEDDTLSEVFKAFAEGEGDAILVIDDDGAITGLVTLAEIRQSLALTDSPTLLLAKEIARPVPPATTAAISVFDALRLMEHEETDLLLVVRTAAAAKLRGLSEDGDWRHAPLTPDIVLGTLSAKALAGLSTKR